MKVMRKVEEMTPETRVLQSWYEPLKEAIEAEQYACESGERGKQRKNYGHFLLLVKAETLSVITLKEVLSRLLGGEKYAGMGKCAI